MPDCAPVKSQRNSGAVPPPGDGNIPERKPRPDVARGQRYNDVRHAGDADHIADQRVEDAEAGNQDDGDKEHHPQRLILHEARRQRVAQQQQRAQRKVDPARDNDDRLAYRQIDQGQTVLADRRDLELTENGDKRGVPDE